MRVTNEASLSAMSGSSRSVMVPRRPGSLQGWTNRERRRREFVGTVHEVRAHARAPCALNPVGDVVEEQA